MIMDTVSILPHVQRNSLKIHRLTKLLALLKFTLDEFPVLGTEEWTFEAEGINSTWMQIIGCKSSRVDPSNSELRSL